MFNNLIESSLHTQDLKRRGSFLLFTTAVYAVLFVSAGVASIYAYDTHLKNDDADELMLIGFVPLEPRRDVAPRPHQSASGGAPKNTATVAPALDPHNVVDTINPNNVPPNVGTEASQLPTAHPGVPRSLDDSESAGPPGGGGKNGSAIGPGPQIVTDTSTPPAPPTPTPRPVPRVISKPILNGYALELPKPPYSEMARRVRAAGTVQVQVLIDETGKVVTAHAVSGHPLLVPDAIRAAYRARFAPTKIGDQPVKVSGVINYNFVLE